MNPRKLWNTGLQSETPVGSARLNRAILLLNLGVLVSVYRVNRVRNRFSGQFSNVGLLTLGLRRCSTGGEPALRAGFRGVPPGKQRRVLLVNFFLAFKTNDVQLGLMRTASETSGGGFIRTSSRAPDVATPYSRVLQALDNVAPGQGASVFTPEKLQTIYDAIGSYQSAIERGVSNLVYAPKGADLRAAYADLDKDAREEVEITLGTKFSDAALVQGSRPPTDPPLAQPGRALSPSRVCRHARPRGSGCRGLRLPRRGLHETPRGFPHDMPLSPDNAEDPEQDLDVGLHGRDACALACPDLLVLESRVDQPGDVGLALGGAERHERAPPLGL